MRVFNRRSTVGISALHGHAPAKPARSTAFHVIAGLTLSLVLAMFSSAPVSAAPQWESQSIAQASGNVTSLLISTPAGTASGDLLLAAISTDGNASFSVPLGWTLLNQGSNGGNVSVAVFYRIASAAEPASQAFAWDSSEEAVGAILRYSGVSTSEPIAVLGAADGTNSSPTSPSVTTLSANTRVVRIYGADDDDLSGSPYPAGTTGRLNEESGTGGGTSALGVADSSQTAIGATGTAAFSMGSSEQWRALTVVLAPPGINPLPANDSNTAPAVCTAAAADGSGSISGGVNRYYPGNASVSAGATSISLGTSVGSGASINPGDTLLVIQMQDAVISTSNSNAYGDGSATGTADGSGSTDIRQTGLYEFVVATNSVGTGGGTVNLATALVRAYNRGTNRRFQVVRVPRFGNITLSGNVTATPWNGLAGGIVAMSVQGTLNLNGNSINVSGQGFRGADFAGSAATGSGDSSTDYVVASGNRWGAKGEGIAGGPNVGAMTNTDGYSGGSLARGAPGNAGGGGNDHNAGGGGGSNIGSGGRGGFPYPTGSVGGKGGATFAGYSGRLLLGGGGGAGHKNNAGGTGFGGNGGGLVFIDAGAITPAGGSIVANGSAGDFSVQDGAGGGGAGGTILIRTGSSSVAGLNLQATGGNGGDSYYADNHGPGGGGGGGAVYIAATGATTNVAGGDSGVRRNSGPLDPAVTNHGALAGHRGHVVAPTNVPAPVACDYGDAPAGYSTSTTLHTVDTASGTSPNLYLGSFVDYEWQGVASSDALADNIRDTSGTGAGSDEDGVTFTAPSGGGANILATVAVANNTGAIASVCGWLDVGADGVFDLAERKCSWVVSGGTVNVVFEWVVSATVTRTYYSRFRVCSTANQCNTPTGQAFSGEMEDFSLTYNPTHATIGKVALETIPLDALLSELRSEAGQGDAGSALALLGFYDSGLAESLQGAGVAVVVQALTGHLDPDGDGQVAALRWETLEERGTIGFYLERREPGSDAWQRLNGDLLPGLITAPMGGEYWLVDPQAQAGQTYEYRLIELEARGQTRSYGPWSLSLPQ